MAAGTDPRALLGRELPDLTVDTVEALGEGWDHVAFLVNGDLVFRLPWELVEGTERGEPGGAAPEVALLRAVEGRLPVVVPAPLHVAPDGSYFGYRYLPGRAVAEDLNAWTGHVDGQSVLADLIVTVALAIEEAVPVEAARDMGLGVFATPRHDPAAARAGLEHALVSPQVRAAGEWALSVVPERWARAAARRMATLHADFGLDHWLVDEGGDVYALIDWSDACVAPPEHQVSTLMWDIPELVEAVADRYVGRTGHRIDRDLVVADGILNALGDLGELLAEGEPEGGEDVQRCRRFLETWAPVADVRRR